MDADQDDQGLVTRLTDGSLYTEVFHFQIENIYCNEATNCSAWVVRQHSRYARRPHIYAKVRGTTDSDSNVGVIILSDTGCGTEISSTLEPLLRPAAPGRSEICNLRTFLETTINPGGRLPYLIILTHCHWDHILGLSSFLEAEAPVDVNVPSYPPRTQIIASAKGQFFIEPYSNLQKHSHCADLGIQAPHFQITTWAYDFMELNYNTEASLPLSTDITILHTQGHTPDSLSWYDSELRILHVGDSFHVNSVTHNEDVEGATQDRIHTTFCLESDLASWWGQMGKILGFVREQNLRLARASIRSSSPTLEHIRGEILEDGDGGARDWVLISNFPRVRILTGHTTPLSDAEGAIVGMQTFMSALLSGEVPSKRVADGFCGEERRLWDYTLQGKTCRFSVISPTVVVERGQRDIQIVT